MNVSRNVLFEIRMEADTTHLRATANGGYVLSMVVLKDVGELRALGEALVSIAKEAASHHVKTVQEEAGLMGKVEVCQEVGK